MLAERPVEILVEYHSVLPESRLITDHVRHCAPHIENLVNGKVILDPGHSVRFVVVHVAGGDDHHRVR